MAAEASCMLALVRAPDALYIPNGWWHEVFTPQFALSVNCWFASAAQARASLRPTKLYCFQESYAGFVRRRIEERTARWQQEQDAGQQQGQDGGEGEGGEGDGAAPAPAAPQKI